MAKKLSRDAMALIEGRNVELLVGDLLEVLANRGGSPAEKELANLLVPNYLEKNLRFEHGLRNNPENIKMAMDQLEAALLHNTTSFPEGEVPFKRERTLTDLAKSDATLGREMANREFLEKTATRIKKRLNDPKQPLPLTQELDEWLKPFEKAKGFEGTADNLRQIRESRVAEMEAKVKEQFEAARRKRAGSGRLLGASHPAATEMLLDEVRSTGKMPTAETLKKATKAGRQLEEYTLAIQNLGTKARGRGLTLDAPQMTLAEGWKPTVAGEFALSKAAAGQPLTLASEAATAGKTKDMVKNIEKAIGSAGKGKLAWGAGGLGLLAMMLLPSLLGGKKEKAESDLPDLMQLQIMKEMQEMEMNQALAQSLIQSRQASQAKNAATTDLKRMQLMQLMGGMQPGYY